jgi:hypothetical protein
MLATHHFKKNFFICPSAALINGVQLTKCLAELSGQKNHIYFSPRFIPCYTSVKQTAEDNRAERTLVCKCITAEMIKTSSLLN